MALFEPHDPSEAEDYVGSDVAGYYEGDGYRNVRPLAQALAMELHAWWMRTMRSELVRSARKDSTNTRLQRDHQSALALVAALGHCATAAALRQQCGLLQNEI